MIRALYWVYANIRTCVQCVYVTHHFFSLANRSMRLMQMLFWIFASGLAPAVYALNLWERACSRTRLRAVAQKPVRSNSRHVQLVSTGHYHKPPERNKLSARQACYCTIPTSMNTDWFAGQTWPYILVLKNNQMNTNRTTCT